MENLENLLTKEYKVYVDVLEERCKDGTILPRAITWEDGYTYEIDKVLDRRPAASRVSEGNKPQALDAQGIEACFGDTKI